MQEATAIEPATEEPESPDPPEISPESVPEPEDGPTEAEIVTEPSSVPAVFEPEQTLALSVAELPTIPGQDEFLSLAMQAKVFASSALVPRALQGKPSDVLLVLMTGRDLGIATTTALRKCYVVDGQVTIAPALKLALVRLKGLGSIRPAPGNDDQSATAIVFDSAGNELGRSTFTMEMAERAKLIRDKSAWKTYPHRMLWWRAATAAVDDFFPEVAFGLYAPDELGAFTDAEGEIIDVDAVDVPEGFEGKPSRTVDPWSEADAEAYIVRAKALPEAGRAALKELLRANDLPVNPKGFLGESRKTVEAMLSTIEKRAEKGEFGEVPGPPSEWCEECQTDDGTHGFGCQHYAYSEIVDAEIVDAEIVVEPRIAEVDCSYCWAPAGEPHNPECEL